MANKEKIIIAIFTIFFWLSLPYCLYDLSYSFFIESTRCGVNEFSSWMLYLSLSSLFFFGLFFPIVLWRYKLNDSLYYKRKMNLFSWSLILPTFLFLIIFIVSEQNLTFSRLLLFVVSVGVFVEFVILVAKLYKAKELKEKG